MVSGASDEYEYDHEEPQAPSWYKDGGTEQKAAPPPSISPSPDGGTS